jgi:type I restriction enzyme S subunit
MLGLGCLTLQGFQPLQLKAAPLADGRLASALLADGDLLMSRANTRELVGLVGIYKDVGTPCTYPDLMMRLRPSSETSSEFLQFVLQSTKTRRQVQASAVGTSVSMVKISGKIVCELLLSLPAKAEQDQILTVLAAADQKSSSELAKLAKLKEIKAGLMTDLLTGHIRVTSLLTDTTPGSI